MFQTRLSRLAFGLPAAALLLMGCSLERQSRLYAAETLNGNQAGSPGAEKLTALDGFQLAFGSGFKSAQQASVRRIQPEGAVSYPVDLNAILEQGDSSSNILLRSGDVLCLVNSAGEYHEILAPDPLVIDYYVVEPPSGDLVGPARNRRNALEATVEAFGSTQAAAAAGVTTLRIQRTKGETTREMMVDLQALWTRGDSSGNVRLQPDDRIQFLARQGT